MVSGRDRATQLSAKFSALANDLKDGDPAAVAAAALAAKQVILTKARTRARLKVEDNWVRYRRPRLNRAGSQSTLVSLRGGFAHLAERGSYKQPDGYEIGVRRSTHRRRKAAAKIGREFIERRVLAGPGFGPVTGPVHHPPQRATPFWREGVAAARPITAEVWRKSVRRDLAKHFKG